MLQGAPLQLDQWGETEARFRQQFVRQHLSPPDSVLVAEQAINEATHLDYRPDRLDPQSATERPQHATETRLASI